MGLCSIQRNSSLRTRAWREHLLPNTYLLAILAPLPHLHLPAENQGRPNSQPYLEG